jgi:argininosuccinate synthase
MRDMNLTREWEIDYAKEHGIPVPVTKEKPWSIDENIWSRSIEGGTLISASKPDSIDKTAFNKISNMLCFEETSTQKEGFRNRVSIELSDKLMVALSIDHEYILTVFTVPDVQFGIVLYQLNRTADKLEQILQSC